MARNNPERIRRKAAQQAHAEQAVVEAAQLQMKPTAVPVLIPGQQDSLQTANLLARKADAEEINAINDAARASAKAVRETLLNVDNPVLERHQKSRAAAQIAAATAAQAKET